MFLENKYTRWYYSLVNQAKIRNIDLGYSEKHHIIPKCLGGSNSKDNLVRLTAREHFVAHLLLTKMLNGPAKRKMIFALFRMTSGNNKQQRYNLNNKSYEIIKKKMSAVSSEQNKIRGNSYMTDEIKKKLSNKIPWNKGKKMPTEFRKKLSQISKNRTFTDETRKKLSNSLSGRPKSKFIWKLQNTKTGQIEDTVNLKQWCKDNGFNSNKIYSKNSDWEIIEKYNFKTGKKLI